MKKNGRKNKSNPHANNSSVKLMWFLIAFFLAFVLVMPFISRWLKVLLLFLPKPISTSTAWIEYYGAIISCVVGGSVGGYVAYRIARIQMQLHQEADEKRRSKQLRYDLELEAVRQIQKPLWSVHCSLFQYYLRIKEIVKICAMESADRSDRGILFANLLGECKECGRELSGHLGTLIGSFDYSYRMLFPLSQPMADLIRHCSELETYTTELLSRLNRFRELPMDSPERLPFLRKTIEYCNQNYVETSKSALLDINFVREGIRNRQRDADDGCDSALCREEAPYPQNDPYQALTFEMFEDSLPDSRTIDSRAFLES